MLLVLSIFWQPCKDHRPQHNQGHVTSAVTWQATVLAIASCCFASCAVSVQTQRNCDTCPCTHPCQMYAVRQAHAICVGSLSLSKAEAWTAFGCGCRDHAAWCPYCQKVWIQLEEKQIPYEIEKINMRCYGDKPPAYTAKVKRRASFAANLRIRLSMMLCDILFSHMSLHWYQVMLRSVVLVACSKC